VTSFSAGYAGVREILKTEEYYEQIAALHLADGLHSSSYQPTMDEQMKNFVRFARDATKKKKIMRLTHSSITTSGYASTTETANYLLSHLNLSRSAVNENDRIGTLYSRCDSGYFHLRGYRGTTAEAHLKHLYAMDMMLKATMEQLQQTTGIGSSGSPLKGFRLKQNYPNPFNDQTNLEFFLPFNEFVDLTVFDQRGKRVKSLIRGSQAPGWHRVRFKAGGLASGVYYCVLKAGDNIAFRRMLLIK
ncbi:MAG: T9SS type A sorting domain-containing protein, partial [Calditrichaeota bacterium]|nr:T9SS type A sorting domain-containing protein [Calditrichota bacterium]